MKMWSGRVGRPLDPEFERWQRSFEFDRRLLREELAASRAHARSLKSAAILAWIASQKMRRPRRHSSTTRKPRTFIILWRSSSSP